MSTYLHRVTGYQQSPASSLADLLSGGESTRWIDDGACVTGDLMGLFDMATDGALEAIKEAKKVCKACPVLETCRAWGIKNHADEGVIGGLDRRERQVAAGVRKRDRVDNDAPPERSPDDPYTIEEICAITGLSSDGVKVRMRIHNIKAVGRRGYFRLYPHNDDLLAPTASTRAARVVAEAEELIEAGSGATEAANRLGYDDWRSLERALNRAKRGDLVAALRRNAPPLPRTSAPKREKANA